MQTTANARSIARSAASRAETRTPLTHAQELEEMNAYVQQIKSGSKKEAVALLQRAGIYDAQGKLAEPFRN